MSSSPSPSTPPPKPRKNIYTLLGVPSPAPSSSSRTPHARTFDRAHLWVTSPLFRNPFVFGALRILVGCYLGGTAIAFLVSYIQDGSGESYLSFFTNLCYIGLIAYCFASGVQTLSYAIRWRRNGAGAGYALQSWPRPLQALHVALYSTIITFPFIVTAVYWGLLGGAEVFETPRRAWQGVSVHILNSVLACCELVFSNSPPPPWMALPFTIICLACYLGVAYITYATQGFYTYSFLDPNETGALLAAYIIGILVAQIIIFTLVHFVARLRHRICLKSRRVISFEPYPPSPTSAHTHLKRGRRDPEEGIHDTEGGGGGHPEMEERTPRPSAAQKLEGGRGREEEEVRESMYGVAFGGEGDEVGGEWEEVKHPNVSRPDVGSSEGRVR